MYKARVKQKGQVTIPAKLRSKLQIQEGTIVEMLEEANSILIKPLPPAKPGKVIGEAEYKKILKELQETRENWR